jgi:hypothetical protein
MHEAILWCGFLGAWLLVAGPLDQAVRELDEEEIERDDVAAVAAGVEAPADVSRWWVLLPPVYFYLRHRRSDEYRARVMEAMPEGQLEALFRFHEKASAWMFVAGGAFLIAIKETWELHEGYEWPESVFWILLVAMPVLCIVNTVVRMRRHKDPRAAFAKR